MDTLHELLSEIVKNPDADHLRLMYADALDERGDVQRMDAERAEFVRVQVELAKWPKRKIVDKDMDGKDGIVYDKKRGGSNYYEILGEVAYHYGLKNKDRVDVLFRSGRRCEWKYGLRVHEVEWDGDTDTFLVEDDLSVEESDGVKGMRERERELLAGGCSYQWLGREQPWFSDFVIADWLTWKRGFIEEVQCPLNIFFAHTDDWLWEHNKMAACEKRWSVDLAHGGYTDRDTIATLAHRQRTEHPPECVCEGTLLIPIPCPSHAHPVRKVVLTGSWIGVSNLNMSSPSNKKFAEYIRNQEEYMIWDSIMDVNACVIRSLQNLWPTIQFEYKP